MKSAFEYGSTKKDIRRNKDCITEDYTQELGSSEDQGRSNGIDENRVNRLNCSRSINYREVKRPVNSAGKILERLEFLKNEYLSFLEDDRLHLEFRLKKNKEKEESLVSAIQELEQDVHRLVEKNPSET